MLWAIVAMAGVGYFTRSSSPRQFWIGVLFAGSVVVSMTYVLYWAQRNQWVRTNAVWLVAIGTLVGVLVKLWDVLYRK